MCLIISARHHARSDIYRTVPPMQTTTLPSGKLCMSFLRLSSYSDDGNPGFKNPSLTRCGCVACVGWPYWGGLATLLARAAYARPGMSVDQMDQGVKLARGSCPTRMSANCSGCGRTALERCSQAARHHVSLRLLCGSIDVTQIRHKVGRHFKRQAGQVT